MVHEKIDLVAKVSPIIKQAGQILLGYFGTPLAKTEKSLNGRSQGFVTDADIASENYLIEKLGAIIDGAAFIAEESGNSGKSSDYCWVIDPLDGTTNFAHNLSYFCISVALTHKDKPVFGMIYQPMLDELFYAHAGKGAYLNGKPIAVALQSGSKKMVTIGFASLYSKMVGMAAKQDKPFSMRNFGAMALDLAYIACGRLDAGVFDKVKWWDMAAGIILIEEAGGIITDFQGLNTGINSQSCMATSSNQLHEQLLGLLK